MQRSDKPIRINNTEQIKEKCFELLSFFKEVCEAANIKYSLAYGTMLGAVRHNGYIPWDTDVDVFVFLPDKERFRKAFYEYKKEGILLDDFDAQPHNTHSHDLIKFEGIDDNDVHLDIYYLVGAPNTYEEQKKFARHTYVVEHVIRSKYNRLKDCKKKNRPLVFCAKVIDYCFPDRILKKYLNHLEEKYNFDEAEYVIALANWGTASACIPKSIFEQMISCRFYNDYFAIPKDFDTFLKRTYGEDYMTPKKY